MPLESKIYAIPAPSFWGLGFHSLKMRLYRGKKGVLAHGLRNQGRALYSVPCSLARAIFLQTGTIAHVPLVSKVILLLCQASCCCPVCLCFGNMSLVFHHCVHKPVVSTLRAITYINTHLHTCCIRPHRKIFACFCLLLLPPPLKAPGVGNAAS